MSRPGSNAVVIAAALLCASAPVAAGAPPDAPPDAPPVAPPDAPDARPWAVGVSADDQAAALAAFRDANEQFAAGRLEDAVAGYLSAVARWDHPSIHFNLAVALIRLDRLVEADAHLEASLRFGAAPFERAELHAQALDYQRLLDGQLARLVVGCPRGAATVTLDGQPLLRCPGEVHRTLLPGTHELVAREPGHLTIVRSLLLLPGAVAVEEVAPVRLADAARTVRRWPAWRPWLVTGVGAGLIVAGGPLLAASSSSYAAYDRAVDGECPQGCVHAELPDNVADLEDRARLQSRLAIGAFVAGGVVLAAGVTMIVLNQPRTELPDEDAPQLELAPTPGGVTAGVRLRF